jgi:hypothetical protein
MLIMCLGDMQGLHAPTKQPSLQPFQQQALLTQLHGLCACVRHLPDIRGNQQMHRRLLSCIISPHWPTWPLRWSSITQRFTQQALVAVTATMGAATSGPYLSVTCIGGQ